MLHRYFPLPVKFICGFIYPNSSGDTYEKTKHILQRKFGTIDFESPEINFDFTDYYYEEMGKPLLRRFVSFSGLKKPDSLADIKNFCIKVEKKFAPAGKRSINIDPGYLNEAKLVLASTKDFFHRIYIGKGIYAEVTLYYSKKEKAFTGFTTTFPDYLTAQYKQIFLVIREAYRKQIK